MARKKGLWKILKQTKREPDWKEGKTFVWKKNKKTGMWVKFRKPKKKTKTKLKKHDKIKNIKNNRKKKLGIWL